MTEQDLKQLWKNQPSTNPPLSEATLRKKARQLQRRVAVRNLLEYAAGAVVIPVFAWYMWTFRYPLMQVGSALIIAATLLVLHQLWRRASSRPAPNANAGMASRTYLRTELLRQRDALRSVWRWYVAPFVPGLVLFRWGVETQMAAGGPFARGVLANLLIAAVLLAIIGVNWWSAGRLQKRIEALDHSA